MSTKKPILSQLINDIRALTIFELQRVLGTLRGFLVVLLYLISSILIGGFYVVVIQPFEKQAIEFIEKSAAAESDRLHLPSDQAQKEVSKTQIYEKILGFLADDDVKKLEFWKTQPFIVLYTFWLYLFLIPLLVMMTTYDVLAADNENRTIRFFKPKVSIFAWVFSKFLAHTILLLVAVFFSFAIIYLIAIFKVPDFNALQAILPNLSFLLRLFLYALTFLGVVFLFSAVAKSALSSLLIANIVFFLLWILKYFSYFKDEQHKLKPIGYLSYLSPFSFESNLWQPFSWALLEALGIYALFTCICVALATISLKHKGI